MLELNFDPFPVLETETLQLDQIHATDVEALFEMRSDQAVMQYISRPLAKSKEDCMELIRKINIALEQNEGITWAIRLKALQSLIGTIGFWRINKEHYRGEIGYLLHPRFQGRGIMQEAMKKVLNFGFTDLKLHCIEADVNPFNNASLKILKKNGFKQKAYFNDYYFFEGKFLDTTIHSLINPC